MESLGPEKINKNRWKRGLTLKRDMSSLKNVRLMLKLLKFLEGDQTKQPEESSV